MTFVAKFFIFVDVRPQKSFVAVNFRFQSFWGNVKMISSVHAASSGPGDRPSPSGLKSPRIHTLDALATSESATVVGLNTSNDLQGRLTGMGLTVGAKVEILQGGHSRFKPLLIGVGESRIALGHDIAKMILVETDERKSEAVA